MPWVAERAAALVAGQPARRSASGYEYLVLPSPNTNTRAHLSHLQLFDQSPSFVLCRKVQQNLGRGDISSELLNSTRFYFPSVKITLEHIRDCGSRFESLQLHSKQHSFDICFEKHPLETSVRVQRLRLPLLSSFTMSQQVSSSPPRREGRQDESVDYRRA